MEPPSLHKHLGVSYQLEGKISLQKELKVRHRKDDQLNLVTGFYSQNSVLF